MRVGGRDEKRGRDGSWERRRRELDRNMEEQVGGAEGKKISESAGRAYSAGKLA